MSIQILYGTETGNSKTLAENTHIFLSGLGYQSEVKDMEQVSLSDLKKAKDVLIITSTWGDGEAPSNAQNLLSELKAQTAPSLTGLNYAVFAIGQSWYNQFCQAGIDFDDVLEKLGAHRAIALEKCDDDYDQKHPLWLERVRVNFKKQ